ncbi:LemA family protein [Pseudoxanthomonas gei]|uniref:LemA family protein n=1 Tax=Pseudoxanthomonas gei TaxID=1383030 RepID=A0ABX0AEN0_9GAMM|nr:LemA family protein [Pseudoxanthomonas gei]NDK39876.1 LemA family protein [Pseudoxanthomonas gei]
MSLALIVAAALALALPAWGVTAYNRLVRLRNQVRTAWADVDVQLVRRHDLVPSLVTAVRAYAGHEQAVLATVTELRGQALSAQAPGPLGTIESALAQGIGRLLALQEAYPDLKASENFAQLQRDLVQVEEQLQYARRFYNGAVRDLNDAVQRVPDLWVARAGGFGNAEFFQAEDQGREAVKVELAR